MNLAQVAQGRALFAQACSSCQAAPSGRAARSTSRRHPRRRIRDRADAGARVRKPGRQPVPVAVHQQHRLLRPRRPRRLEPDRQQHRRRREGRADAGERRVAQTPQDALGVDYNADGKGNGFNIPSLLGIQQLPPYYHNGACETLVCVVGNVRHRTANFTRPDVLGNPADVTRVVRFLETIGANTAPLPWRGREPPDRPPRRRARRRADGGGAGGRLARDMYATDARNALLRFDSRFPGVITERVGVTGLGGNLVGIDFRPSTGDVIGVATDNRVYVIDPDTGVSRAIGLPVHAGPERDVLRGRGEPGHRHAPRGERHRPEHPPGPHDRRPRGGEPVHAPQPGRAARGGDRLLELVVLHDAARPRRCWRRSTRRPTRC